MLLTEPEPAALLSALSEAITSADQKRTPPRSLASSHRRSSALSCTESSSPPNYHHQVSQMYSWLQESDERISFNIKHKSLNLVRVPFSPQVAHRTVKVYDQVSQRVKPALASRFRQLHELGPVSGTLAIFVVAVQHLCLMLLCYLRPACEVDVCPDFLFADWVLHRTMIQPLPLSACYANDLAKRRHFVMNGT